ncbi:AraC family transcriptional regulator [Luteimonas sp. SX5]|uniref:AraC family transcriptional regulator n=1 Tax=Luteimonas galliterrae TaxID=2940486 RepID=A0ABT0MEX1_9GAMM|nr:AraC family transcriptional regulator [Luteimonas galliterrae]MCL1633414.1 AraC family transcriptional regulator [Luteimonas galliterrae]
MNDKVSNVVPARAGLEAQQAELADRIARNVPGDGLHDSAVPGLALIRASEPSQPLPTVYHPSVCVVVQGRKRALLGDDVYAYDPLNYLVVSMTLPMVGQIIEASPEKPYLCLRIDIDPALIGDLLVQLGPAVPAQPSGERALFVARTSASLLDAVLRLVRLLDTPDEAAVLAPLALREIHYRVLVGELGQKLRELCEVDGPSQRIARAIELLKTRYAEPLRIDDLAMAAHMSASSLHQRFKAATAMSPLQFQKQLRLQEARRLMLMDGLEAASAGHRVGYESPSQFSREYRRLFGAPPKREIEAMRAAGT